MPKSPVVPFVSPSTRSSPIQRAIVALPDGCDANKALARITASVGWGVPDRGVLDVSNHDNPTSADIEAARSLGGGLVRVVIVERTTGARLHATAGPCWLPAEDPLSRLDEGRGGIGLDLCNGRRVVISGPASTLADVVPLVDTAAEVARIGPSSPQVRRGSRDVEVAEPFTTWLIRLAFPGLAPTDDAIAATVAVAGLNAGPIVAIASEPFKRWLVADVAVRAVVEEACARVSRLHRIDSAAWRALAFPPTRPLPIATAAEQALRWLAARAHGAADDPVDLPELPDFDDDADAWEDDELVTTAILLRKRH